MKILLVEDEADKARTLSRWLTRLGCEVQHVWTYEGAYEELQSPQRFAGVISDWRFPNQKGSPPIEGNGAHIVTWARKLQLPVIVISGSDRPPTFEGTWVSGDWSNALSTFVSSLKGSAR